VGALEQLEAAAGEASTAEVPTADNLDHLHLEYGYWYLATPYSRFPDGTEAAYHEACRIARVLIDHGIGVFSPIAHSHGISLTGPANSLDHGYWLRADKPLMDAAAGLLVARLPTWRESFGVTYERGAFLVASKPILYVDPYTFEVVHEE